MRLLIAEDELDLAEALTVFFEKNHFTVDAVHNGFDAYEYAAAGGYDAIILDIMMPKLDGIQVLQRLRAEEIGTPVMMLTAKGRKEDRITGFNADADQRELLALIAGNRGTIPVSDTAPADAPEPPDMPEGQTPPDTGQGADTPPAAPSAADPGRHGGPFTAVTHSPNVTRPVRQSAGPVFCARPSVSRPNESKFDRLRFPSCQPHDIFRDIYYIYLIDS